MLRIKREFNKKGNYDKRSIKEAAECFVPNSIQNGCTLDDYPFLFINYF